MRVLVTGGAGYVGSHTCVALLNAGWEVTILDDFSNSSPDVLVALKRITGRDVVAVEADIRNFDAVSQIVAQGGFDAVIHFAALKSAPESISQPLRYWEVNVGGMTSLLRALAMSEVRMMVFSSSAIVYGEQETVPTPETAPLFPTNPYASTKVAGEQLLLNFAACCPGLKACILRYFNPIGAHYSGLIGENPKQAPSNLFPLLLAACRSQSAVDVLGTDYATSDGSAVRDFVHVMDVADAHLAALELLASNAAAAPAVRTFNIGTGVGVSVRNLIGAVEKATGIEIHRRDGPRRSGDIMASIADPTLAAAELGWRARRSLMDACQDGWRWSISQR